MLILFWNYFQNYKLYRYVFHCCAVTRRVEFTCNYLYDSQLSHSCQQETKDNCLKKIKLKDWKQTIKSFKSNCQIKVMVRTPRLRFKLLQEQFYCSKILLQVLLVWWENICRWRQAAKGKATSHIKMQDRSWCDNLKWTYFSGSREHFSNICSVSREHQHHISINLNLVLSSVLSFWDFKEDCIACHSWTLVYPTINQPCFILLLVL